jgi:hypothetical protein
MLLVADGFLITVAIVTEQLFNQAKALALIRGQFYTFATAQMLVDRYILIQTVVNLVHNAI